MLLHLRSTAKPEDSIRLSVKVAESQLAADRIYQVGERPVITAIEIDGAAGLLEAQQSADLIVRVYDQYGLLIKDTDWLNGEQGVIASSDNTRAASVSSITMDSDQNTVVRVTAEPSAPTRP